MLWKAVLVALVAAIAVLAVYVRMAPVRAAGVHDVALPEGPSGVAAGVGSHTVLRDASDPMAALAQLDRIARATARTRVLAGSPQEGRITYVTRSALWGFPDFTTIEARPVIGQIAIFARPRFGQADLGVNRARVEAWLAALDAGAGADTPEE